MVKLEVKMLGRPEIRLDGRLLQFPYRKVEGLFYYLLVKKQIRRIRAAALLWGEKPDTNARKNLRNALYQLRQVVGERVFNTPDQYIIELETGLQLESDLERFLKAGPEEAVELYQGEFLQDFIVKNCPEYQGWLAEQRNYFHQHYLKLMHNYVDYLKGEKNWVDAVYHLELLINQDEFNEAAYRDLMGIYLQRGEGGRVIKLYNRLKEKLSRELGIAPDPETVRLYQEVKRRMGLNRDRETQYIGRTEELERLLDNLSRFKRGDEARSVLITGEAGIGKTTLVKKALESCDLTDLAVFSADCYPAEESYIYKPWKKILEQIKVRGGLEGVSTSQPWRQIVSFLFPSLQDERAAAAVDGLNFESIQYQSAVEALLYFLQEAARKQRMVIVLEDLQWCDRKSLELLSLLIYENRNRDIMMISSSRNERQDRLAEYCTSLKRSELLETITLKRLNLSQTGDFIRRKLPHLKLTEDLLKRIYQETEGNTFFLVESLKLLKEDRDGKRLSRFLTSKGRDILAERLVSLSPEARKLLNLVSLPFDRISFQLLARLSGQEENVLLDLLEELESHYLLEAAAEGYYRFTHSKLREYIYQNISLPRLKLLHRKLANLLEEELQRTQNQREYFSRLIYHYRKAGNRLKELEYLIKEAGIYFHHSHELFPVINDSQLKANRLIAINQEESSRYLREISRLLDLVRDREDRDTVRMELEYLNMRILYLAAQGNYQQAGALLEELIDKAQALEREESLLEAYQLLGGLAIQGEDIKLIEKSGLQLYQLARARGERLKMGIALRFLGISYLYQRNYPEAERMFSKALQLFKEVERRSGKERYTLGIAAIYNYLGEIKRHKGLFREALDYYQRSIGLCEAREILSGLGVFYTNAGMIYYELGAKSQAETSFKRAVEIFNQLQTVWGYSIIAHSYLALLAVEKGDFGGGYQQLSLAGRINQKHYKRYWEGILLRVKAVIAGQMAEDRQLYLVFKGAVPDRAERYAREAAGIFQEIGARYEVESVEQLL